MEQRVVGELARTRDPSEVQAWLRRAGIGATLLAPVSWIIAPSAIRAMYADRLGRSLGRVMAGRGVHPVEHYLELASTLRLTVAVLLLVTGLGSFLLSLPGVRSTVHRVITGGRWVEDGYWWTVVFGVVAAAAVLRIPGLGSTSLWLDEAMVSMVSVEGLSGLFDLMARESSAAPGYHILQVAFFTAAPQSVAVARLPSLLASMGTVILLLATPRWGVPRGAAAFAALAIAISPAHVGFARDATQYAIAVAIATLLVASGLALYARARGASSSRMAAVALPLWVTLTPWFAYPSVFVALALLGGLLLSAFLIGGRPAQLLKRSVGVSGLALIVSSAGVHAVVARRQFYLLENWYLAANYPSTSGLSPTLWLARALDSHFAIIAGGQVTGRWSASFIDGFRSPLLEGSALGWVMLIVLLAGLVRGLRHARSHITGGRMVPEPQLLMMGVSVLLVLGSIVAAALGLYPFGGIHQQLHAAPVLLLGAGSAAVQLLTASSRPVKVGSAVGALVLFLASAVPALPTVYEEREDIVSAVMVGVDGREGRGLTPIADDRVWVYSAARPAVLFHFPGRAFQQSRSGPTDIEGMLAEVVDLAAGGRAALIFSQIYPHPEEGDHRRALQSALVAEGWTVEEEIHHPNTVALIVHAANRA